MPRQAPRERGNDPALDAASFPTLKQNITAALLQALLGSIVWGGSYTAPATGVIIGDAKAMVYPVLGATGVYKAAKCVCGRGGGATHTCTHTWVWISPRLSTTLNDRCSVLRFVSSARTVRIDFKPNGARTVTFYKTAL